jgi:hypothetical protein
MVPAAPAKAQGGGAGNRDSEKVIREWKTNLLKRTVGDITTADYPVCKLLENEHNQPQYLQAAKADASSILDTTKFVANNALIEDEEEWAIQANAEGPVT